MAPPLTDTERQAIVADIKAGHPRNTIARNHNRSVSTITLTARQHGLSFDRSMTKEATQAQLADVEARRAELRSALVEDAHQLRAALWSPAKVGSWYQGNYYEHTVPEPPAADKRALAIALGIVIDKSETLAALDAEGHSAVDRWLLGITGGDR